MVGPMQQKISYIMASPPPMSLETRNLQLSLFIIHLFAFDTSFFYFDLLNGAKRIPRHKKLGVNVNRHYCQHGKHTRLALDRFHDSSIWFYTTLVETYDETLRK